MNEFQSKQLRYYYRHKKEILKKLRLARLLKKVRNALAKDKSLGPRFEQIQEEVEKARWKRVRRAKKRSLQPLQEER